MNLDDPTEVALATIDLLAKDGIPHALYGGLALAAYGEPRETRDVDLAVVESRTDRIIRALTKAGWSVQQAFESVTFGGLHLSRITLLGRSDDTGLNLLDLVEPRSARYADTALSRAVTAPLSGQEITLLGPEDFVAFKVLSSRERDLHDAASVLRRMRSDMDLDMLSAELTQLAKEIPDHDIRRRWSTVEQLSQQAD